MTQFERELESSDLTAKQAAARLLGIYAIWSLIRIALTNCVAVPVIFNDEWGYLELARSIAAGHAPTWAEVPVRLPCWLYPALISPFLHMRNILTALKFIQAFNVL